MSPSGPKKKRSSNEDPVSSETTSVPTTSTTPSTSLTPSTSSSSTPATSSSVVPVVPVEGIEITSQKSLTKFIEDPDFIVFCHISPENATNKDITWSSSKTSVATVQDGTVSIVGEGTTTITVTTVDGGFSDSLELEVLGAKPIEKTSLKYTYDDYKANNTYGLDNCPLVGHPKLLVLPIWFTDSDDFINEANKEMVRSDIEKAYTGTNEETGWRSVSGFYKEESKDEMVLEATVTDWYNVGRDSEYYADNDYGLGRVTSLVSSAANNYFTNHPEDARKNYDTNEDGYLDGVMMIYAAADYRSHIGAGTNLWAYCYWTGNVANKNSPTAKAFFWASYDFMYDEDKAIERTGKSYFCNGDCSHCNIDAHCFIHEMGHVLGLDDYYDYSDSGLTASGGFSMQDFNIGGHDPYSVMAYGWADPYIPTESNVITINDFQSSHDLILLANHEVDSPFDEYLLLELFTPTGLNELDCNYSYSGYQIGPKTTGIRLWHVDARLTYPVSWDHLGNITWATDLITDPTYIGAGAGVYHAMTNTYTGGSASPLGEAYYNYNILQLIRNDTSITYRPARVLGEADLFYEGDSYDMTTYASQYVNAGKMNSNKDLGWSFKVNSIENNQAVITVIKN